MTAVCLLIQRCLWWLDALPFARAIINCTWNSWCLALREADWVSHQAFGSMIYSWLFAPALLPSFQSILTQCFWDPLRKRLWNIGGFNLCFPLGIIALILIFWIIKNDFKLNLQVCHLWLFGLFPPLWRVLFLLNSFWTVTGVGGEQEEQGQRSGSTCGAERNEEGFWSLAFGPGGWWKKLDALSQNSKKLTQM